MKNRNIITLSILLLLLSNGILSASNFFSYQWVSISKGFTNRAFKENSGNKGNGISSTIDFSTTLYKRYFITFGFASADEMHVAMFDPYTPLEYVTQRVVMFGKYFIWKDFALLPSIGYSWISGINRGEWIAPPGGGESYKCESIPFNGNGVSWALQMYTNANGWLGIGLKFSGMTNSPKDYWATAILLKIGLQKNEYGLSQSSGW